MVSLSQKRSIQKIATKSIKNFSGYRPYTHTHKDTINRITASEKVINTVKTISNFTTFQTQCLGFVCLLGV